MADNERQAQPAVELDDRRGTDQAGIHASVPSHMRRHSSTLRGLARLEARQTIDARQWRTFKENELNPLTDLRLLDHVKDVDENLSCPICRCAFVDHVVLECNHAFCRDCLRQTWTEHSPFGPRGNCPTCRTPAKLPPRSNANRIIGNMLDELEVKCPKHEQGCSIILKRAQVDDHVKLYCSYGRVECSAPQCHEPVSRIDSAHDCMHFPATCLDCHATMMQADLHAHWSSECPDHRTECKNCQKIVLYRELHNHNTQECPAVRVSCPGSVVGCTTSLKREQMEDHLQACMLAKIAPFTLAQKQKIEEQEVAQLQLNRRIDVLENGFKHIQSILDEHDLLAEDSADLAYVPTDFSLTIQSEGITPDLGSTFTPHPTLVPDSAPRRWPRNASVSTDFVQDWPPNETSVANTHGWLASAQATADNTSEWPRDLLDLPSPPLRHQRSQRSRAAPIHHLMSMHETLREEVSRVATALSDLDGRQSMQMLNDNLRTRDEMAYLNGAVARVSREIMVLRAQQAPNTAVAVPREYGENAGAGAGVEAAVNAVANAASALRGVARMASSAGSSSGPEMGGRLTRRSTNDENRTKL